MHLLVDARLDQIDLAPADVVGHGDLGLARVVRGHRAQVEDVVYPGQEAESDVPVVAGVGVADGAGAAEKRGRGGEELVRADANEGFPVGGAKGLEDGG